MKCPLVLARVTLWVTLLGTVFSINPELPETNTRVKRGMFFPFRNMSPILPVQRASRGQTRPLLRSRPRLLSRSNTRYIVLPQGAVNSRNARPQRPVNRLLTSSRNRGTSSLTAVNIGPSGTFRRGRFFTVPTISRSMTQSFSANPRLSIPRSSLSRSSWPRRRIVPAKSLPVETRKMNNGNPISFHPNPTKGNATDTGPSSEDNSVKTLNPPSRSLSSNRSPGQSTPIKSNDSRPPSVPRSYFFSPHRVTNMGFGPRVTGLRRIGPQYGPYMTRSNLQHRSRLLPVGRQIPVTRIGALYSRPDFKDVRSMFRSPSARVPVSFSIPGYGSSDNRISPWTPVGYKSIPQIENKSFLPIGDPSRSKNTVIQSSGDLTETFGPGVFEINQSGTKVNNNNPKMNPISNSVVTSELENSERSGNASSILGSNRSDLDPDNRMMAANQPLVGSKSGIGSNGGGLMTANLAQGPINAIDLDRPKAEAFPQDSDSIHLTRSRDVSVRSDTEKLDWLTEIADTPEGLEEAIDDGRLLGRLHRSRPHTYTSLMTALRKGSHFDDDVVSDLKSEGQWEKILRAAGVSANDRIEQDEVSQTNENKLGWLTQIANERDTLEEAIDDGRLVRGLKQTGPHTYEELMAALHKGLYFSDSVIADLKSEGQWKQILKAAGISAKDLEKTSRTRNLASNIEIKVDETEPLNLTQAEPRADQDEHLAFRGNHQIASGDSATGRDQKGNPGLLRFSDDETNGDISQTTQRVDVSLPKVLRKNLTTKNDSDN